MLFPEFADRLRKIIGCGESTIKFTKSLFETILPDGDDLMEGIKDSTLKAYYNGNTPITKLAQKINPVKRMEQFEEYIYEYDDLSQSLADAFVDVAPEITACNCGEIITDIFKSIIETASATATEKKVASSSKSKAEMTEDQKEIFDNLSQALGVFARRADAIVHEAAEQSRKNKKDHANAQSDFESIEGEVIDDASQNPSNESKGVTIIQQQTNVIQNGNNNVSLTNNGTINLNF